MADLLIKKITLPNGKSYDIYDATALHDATAFDAAGAAALAQEAAKLYADGLIAGLGSILKFKGTKATAAEITALTNCKVGDVWLCTANHKEYVCIDESKAGTAAAWEILGFDVSLDGYVTKAQHNSHAHAVNVNGTASSSAVSGTASIAANKVVTSLTEKHIGATATGTAVAVDGTVTAVTGFLGDHTTAAAITQLDEVTVNSASASDVNIDKYTFANKTASKATAATAISVPNTTAGTAVSVAKAGTAKQIPNVTNAGSASTWAFSVDANGVLTVSGANSVAPTLGTAIEIIPAVANGTVTPAVAGTAISIPQYTFADVTSSYATKEATGYTASKVTTSAVTVASTTPASTANAITALSAFSTDKAAKGVKITSQPTVTLADVETGGVVVTSGGVKEAVTGSISGTAVGQAINITVDTDAAKPQLS